MYEKEGSDKLGFNILDPQGDCICWVESRSAADALLSHLNR